MKERCTECYLLEEKKYLLKYVYSRCSNTEQQRVNNYVFSTKNCLSFILQEHFLNKVRVYTVNTLFKKIFRISTLKPSLSRMEQMKRYMYNVLMYICIVHIGFLGTNCTKTFVYAFLIGSVIMRRFR